MRGPSFRGRNPGFTLVEAVVACMLMSLVLAVLYRLHSHFQATIQTDISNRLAMQMSARKAADSLLLEVKKGTDLVRPFIGETTSFLVYKDIKNRMCLVFLDRDPKNSAAYKKTLYCLKSYLDDYSGVHKADQGKVLVDCVERAAFTALTPNSVQISLTLANAKQTFQFVTHVAALNLGDLE